MRVHNQIRADATFRKRKIFLLDNGATNTFLTVSATEFVTNLSKISIRKKRKETEPNSNWIIHEESEIEA